MDHIFKEDELVAEICTEGANDVVILVNEGDAQCITVKEYGLLLDPKTFMNDQSILLLLNLNPFDIYILIRCILFDGKTYQATFFLFW